MTMQRVRSTIVLLAPIVLASVSGCTLIAKGTPLEVRYFSVEAPRTTASVVQKAPATKPVLLRLGRITSGSNLRTRILHRDTEYEVLEYEELRWTENPEEYLRRSLSRALFEENPIEQAVSGNVPTLDVDLVAFEEVRHGPKRAGRVELRYRLHDDRRVLANGSIVSEQPARSDDIQAVVGAVAAALSDASTQLAATILKAAP